jgi:2-C-methyl-D-erythritol 4-phosphate cytidylyltransferase
MSNKNVFAVILAGGVGTRMGNVDKPKQFLKIGGKPIIIHTIEKFILNDRIEQVIVLTPKQWINHTKDLIKKYIPMAGQIAVIEGGEDRNGTIMNSIAYIEENYGLDEDTVIITHDSVRPFVSHRIIEENIDAAKEFGACDTVVPATDTIVRSDDQSIVTEIPDRALMYQGQTPQSFKALTLKNMYEELTDEEKKVLTDACKILVLKGAKVHLVTGETGNLKVTYPYDLKVAEALLEGNE